MSKKQKIKGAMEIVEESAFILKRNVLNVLPLYYVGSLPFMISFLYFWADMCHSGFAEDHIIFESLCLAALFIWMKCWHAVYCRKIDSIIRLQPAPRYSFMQVMRLVSTQSFFSGTAVILLPFAMVVTIPFAWVYAFYQNIPLNDDGERPVKEIFNRAWQGANTWPGQNHVILCIISAFSIFIILNICIVIYFLPVLLKMLFGIETVMSMSGTSVLNTTFLIVTLVITYLVVDPLLKASYTVRSFYIYSVKTGDDILTDLFQLKSVSKGLSCLLLFIVFTAFAGHVIANEKTDAVNIQSAPEKIIPAEEMDQAIEKVSRQSEFAWRIKKEKENIEEGMGPFERFGLWMKDVLAPVFKFAKNILKKWLEKLFKAGGHSTSGGMWKGGVYLALYIILAVLFSFLAVILWRHFKKRKPALKMTGESIPSVPDLTDDFVDPVELPAERWLSIGYDLMKKQSFRLALRAFYLAILSHLAEKRLISIARYKTNFDYILELRRRGHEHRELINIFTGNVQVFDRTWYGMHEVTDTVLQGFIDDHERMVKLVHG